MSENKCDHCPLRGQLGPCPGERNSRVCERADTQSTMYSPSLVRKLLGFAKAAIQHLAAGSPLATEAQKVERRAICNTCDYFKDGGCLKCGCPSSGLETKIGWADQTCPLDPPRWAPIPTDT